MTSSRNRSRVLQLGGRIARGSLRSLLVFLRFTLLLTVLVGFAGAGFAFFAYRVVERELPQDLHALREPPSKASLVFSSDGELIGEFYMQKRIVVDFDSIPEHIRAAFVAAEDGRFWEHPGFDPLGITRAAISNFRGTGSKQGASTITQQLTRLLLLSNERTYYRKMKELILSMRVEATLDKRTILEMYLNRVYLGHGAYGVQAAATTYFGKELSELSIAEAALLAGLVQRPSGYSPFRDLDAARKRRSYVIDRLLKDGQISESQAAAAHAEPITLVDEDQSLNHLAAPYFVEHVRKWAQKRFGTHKLFDGGLRIHTTLDLNMQIQAEAALKDGLDALDRRIGFRGPLGHLEGDELAEFLASPPTPYLPGGEAVALSADAMLYDKVAYVGAVVEIPKKKGAVVVAVSGTRLPVEDSASKDLLRWREGDEPKERPPGMKPVPDPRGEPRQGLRVGDLLPVTLAKDRKGDEVFVLAQKPDVQGAMVVIEPATGALRAMVGGYDYETSVFNRVTQARRQIGSAFKPIIYTTAMSRGVNHLDRVMDSPVAVPTAGGVWSPKNYDGKYLGSITLRTALAKSLNTVSVRLVVKVGVDAIIDMARKLGIRSPIPRHISIALGTPDIKLIEIAGVYATLANGGKAMPRQGVDEQDLPGRFVERVTSDTGELVADFSGLIPTEQAIPAPLAYLAIDLMKAVVERGTGKKALRLGRPTAGKTGTSTEWRDAWFVGTTADLLAAVWVGRDDFTPIGARATGGGAALPIWLQFMEAAHPPTPVRDFPIPDDVSLVLANELTGMPAPPGSKQGRLVPFLRGHLPDRFTTKVFPERFDQVPATGERFR